MLELLTPQQMALADQSTIDGGMPGIDLMEAAGAFLQQVVRKHFSKTQKVLVVCGPGNNGGDGFILARLLRETDISADIFVPLGTEPISGDARIAYERLNDRTPMVDNPEWSSYDLIVDALFGAGLSKEIKGELGGIVSQINASSAWILAVDLPSGINGETGAICGNAIEADVTATFFRYKPGHFLLPGRLLCGTVEVGQIGIDDHVLETIGVNTFHNVPQLWEPDFPKHRITQHKYARGHTLVMSGPVSKSGAARLMARAALRMGSGLVTLASASDVLPIHASRLDSVMFAEVNDADAFTRLLYDERLNCVCVGPGMPPDESTRLLVSEVFKADRLTVLDAGALSAFDGCQDVLIGYIAGNNREVVITPHSGEFQRLFPALSALPSKLEMAKQAAATIGGVVVLKGADTVVADGSGQAAIASNAPPWLATAGSGDVLTGMIAGLIAQGMQAFHAACAAVWIHGEAANVLGPGMISSDLDQGIRDIIKSRRFFEA
jgi:hydroxyethylthiazole kinase-like uncharacterized protein yjeF